MTIFEFSWSSNWDAGRVFVVGTSLLVAKEVAEAQCGHQVNFEETHEIVSGTVFSVTTSSIG